MPKKEEGPQPDPGQEGSQPDAAPKRESAPFDLAMARTILLATEKEKAENPGAYEQAKATYGAERAEHVAGSVERMLDERERLVEEEIAANPRKAGAIERAWRKTGDVSLIPKSWRESFDSTDFGKTRVGQIFIRSLNMRTAISLSLLGVGFGVGFGSIVGMGTLIARIGIGTLGTYFGSQALMEGIAQKSRFVINQKKLNKAAEFNFNDVSEAGVKQREANSEFLEEETARLEAAALLAGKRLDDIPGYERIKALFIRYAEQGQVEAGAQAADQRRKESARRGRLAEIMDILEDATRRKERDFELNTRGRKAIAVAVAMLFPIGRLMALTEAEMAAIEGRSVAGQLRLVSAADAMPSRPPAAVEMAPRGPSVPPAPEVAPVGPDSSIVKPSPETVAAVLREAVAAKAATVPEALADAEQALGAVMTIESGGNIWKSAMRLVETGQVSRPQFEKAWANSYVEIAGQGKIPISKVGLVHAGDVVRFNREAGVFEVIPKSGMPVGSDKNLFAAYERLGKEAPEWLKKSVGAPLKPHEALNTLFPTEIDELARVKQFEEDMAAQAGVKGPGLDTEAKIAAGHGGETVAGAEKSPPSPEALAKIQKSLEYFANSNLADQEEMMRALAKRAEADPMVKTLLDQLRESPAYAENKQAYVRLINRLIDFEMYEKIRGMSLREVIVEGVKAQIAVQDARADGAAIELDARGRALRRLTRLIDQVGPDVAARAMSVETFLKIAPKRLLELITELKF